MIVALENLKPKISVLNKYNKALEAGFLKRREVFIPGTKPHSLTVIKPK
jgi:hypothetical protein